MHFTDPIGHFDGVSVPQSLTFWSFLAQGILPKLAVRSNSDLGNGRLRLTILRRGIASRCLVIKHGSLAPHIYWFLYGYSGASLEFGAIDHSSRVAHRTSVYL